MNNSKKYKIQGTSPHPHIGKLIQKKLHEKKLTYAEVARRIGVNPQVFQAYLPQASLQFGVLWKIGIAIEYNFFADLMSYLPPTTLNSGNSAFQQKIKEQNNEIADLKKEIEIYKNILNRN
jgi:transcriptional regulator with XRE-family HTH domain